jgi:hypothetical protein
MLLVKARVDALRRADSHPSTENPMSKDKTRLDSIIDDLKRTRDELRLKLHLGAADARTEWEALEKKWGHLEGRLEGRLAVVGKEAEAAGENIGEALELVANEIRAGYERVKKLV